jgi:5-methylcytosine-specific restriction endonuclease McrA
MYTTPQYKANRKAAIAREPTCHWRLPGCTIKSTTADHLVAPFQGGTNELTNLVGSCRHCNEARDRALGHQMAKANRERRRRAH